MALPSPVEVALARDESRVSQARRIGTSWLRNACHVSKDRVDFVEVVISELFTNAVLHGRGDTISFRMTHTDGQVRLEINDHSPSAVPSPARANPDDEGGRGLWLVDTLIDALGGRWGFTADGTIAWCVLPVAPQPSYETRDHDSEDRRREL
ncbi:ATP-binding protein [Streptomyces sp. 8N616]|uniref:ATP-binding protein n=1 Tax=Streptomyces sp. 8N616 TaxID=3457414 RepID=UPI003FD35A09